MSDLRDSDNFISNIRILHVEDEEDQRSYLHAALKRYFTNITSLSSSQEAFETLQSQEFDVLLSDLKLPNMHGIDLCSHAKTLQPDIQIIILSANYNEENLIELIRLGIFRFLAKPIDLELIKNALKDLCKKLHFESQAQKYQETLQLQNRQLHNLNRRLSRAEHATNMGYWEWKTTTDIFAVSTHLLPLLGIHNHETSPSIKWYLEQTPPEERQVVIDAMEGARRGKAFSIRHRFIDHSGEEKMFSVTGEPLDEIDGVIIGTIQNITHIWKLEEDLILSSEIIENSIEGILIADRDLRIEKINRSFMKMTGYTEEEILGKTPSLLRSGWHDESFYQAFWYAINTQGYWEGEIWDRKKSGELYACWLSVFAILDSQKQVKNYIGMSTDITQIKKDQERIATLAYYDPLTNLPNRLLFTDRLKKSMELSKRNKCYTILLFIDMDNFKLINDTLGHKIGDMFLIEISKRIQSSLRESDTVARLGGDEFTVIIPDATDIQDGGIVAEKILESFDTPCEVEEHKIHCSGSIGISVYDASMSADNTDEMLKNADTAMYHAKMDGKKTFRYYEEKMQECFGDFIKIEHALWEALENNELELYYQPIMDCRRSDEILLEGLIRWNHEGEVKAPGTFLHVAEKTELIIHIGKWVLDRAVSQLRQWSDAGKNVVVSINISPIQFKDRYFVDNVLECLQKYDVKGSSLILEITETVMLHDPEEVVSTIHTLKEKGIRFSLDDFGSGYSSLSYLRKLPVDNLKIDKSFVLDSPDDESCQDIIRGIIHIAHSLDLKVIAEGSETDAHCSMLKETSCDAIQGFCYSRPIPLDQVNAYIDSNFGTTDDCCKECTPENKE